MKIYKIRKGEDFIPLCDLLNAAGLCQTGGQAKIHIAEGEVLVDGEVELRKRCKVLPGQEVSFNGSTVKVS